MRQIQVSAFQANTQEEVSNFLKIAQVDGYWNASSKVSPTKSTPSFWSKRAAPRIKFPAHGKLKTNICMIFQFRLTFNAKSHSKKTISSLTLVPQIRPLLENCCDLLPSFFHDAIDVSVRCQKKLDIIFFSQARNGSKGEPHVSNNSWWISHVYTWIWTVWNRID